MKTLIIDIERSPSIATIWDLWNNNIGINQLLNDSEVLCFAARWDGSDDVMYYSRKKHGKRAMLKRAWRLLDEADEVVGYNTDKFDLKVLNAEFLAMGLGRPSPFKSIDLLKVVKKHFKLISNKLDYVLKFFKLGQKMKHEGHELWLRVMNNDEDAWKTMEEYNIRDIIETEKLYNYLRSHGWLTVGHNHAAEEGHCSACGSDDIIRSKKWYYTRTMRYRLWQCRACKNWSRERKGEVLQPNILVRQ